MIACARVILLFAVFVNIAAHCVAQNATFWQHTFNLDGQQIDDTSWGSVDLSYVPNGGDQYFNLNVNNQWVIQNASLNDFNGVGQPHDVRMNFDFTSPRSGPSRSFDYGMSITPAPLDSQPVLTAASTAFDDPVLLTTGVVDESILPLGPAPLLTAFDEPNRLEKTGHSDWQTQPQGRNECGPGSVSDSLKFLKRKHNLNIPDEKISIEAMKQAMGWTANYGVEGRPGFENYWPDLKDKYLKDNNIPITTIDTKNFEEAYDAIAKGCDCELRVPGHVVAVVGMVFKRKTIEIQYSDVTMQDGMSGGTTQTTQFWYSTMKFNGGPGISGKELRSFVIECPNVVAPIAEPTSLLAISPLALLILWRRRR